MIRKLLVVRKPSNTGEVNLYSYDALGTALSLAGIFKYTSLLPCGLDMIVLSFQL